MAHPFGFGEHSVSGIGEISDPLLLSTISTLYFLFVLVDSNERGVDVEGNRKITDFTDFTDRHWHLP